ncbi:MAG: AraC family transcriptional regulator ligand-binding domain-containing protein, partial [Candidatus Competibacteraceae bacterium]|nr:AraC family transcriptional regulator ligand-binding domain-containing protein [Candidatus Competibacteraceae bacterium]
MGDPPCENPPNRLKVFATGVDETAEKAVDKDTVSICFVKEAIYGASQRGLDVDAMLRSAGISPDLLELPDARVSAAHYGVLWHVVARALNDELFGLDSHPMRHGSFKLLCFAVLGAGTLEKAIRRALDFL